MNDRTKTALIWLVSIIWAGGLIVGMIPGSDYNPPLALHLPLMLVLGSLFQSKRNGDKE